MRQRILGLLGGRRRRSLLGVTVVAATAAVFMISSALAVHGFVFQLDGDVDSTTTTTVGGRTQTIDWDQFIDASGTLKPRPADFGASSFDRDFRTNLDGSFSTSDSTTFATGSKDTLAITPGWQCNQDNNVLSKNDIMNAYAASYTDPVSGDEILYFALERNANTGTADVGFWFLQDGRVNCVSPGGSTAFTGDHTDGDLLVVSEFTAGGTVSTIQVYRWNGGATGSLGTTAIASGVDCESPSTPVDDKTCATVNTGTITTPWLTANKQDGIGHSLRVSEFFEGGINLTDSGLGGQCFNVFLADTRSSTSLTATLFDFSRGRLALCVAAMTTQVSATEPVIPGAAVHDTATVKGNRPVTPTGDVTFFLCGPIATGACVTGGTNIGTGTLSGMGDTATAVSPDVNTAASPLTPGRYCFRAEWPGDLNYPAALVEFGGPDGTNECFTVRKLDSQTVTTPVDGSGTPTSTITLGGSIFDRAVVTGTEAGGDPTGEVNFFVCGPIADPDATCDTGGTAVAGNPQTLVSDGVATTFTSSATSGAFTPTEVGRYCFRADYLGSNIYLPSSDSGANECFRVTDTTATATHQIWLPNDRATITSNGAPISGTLSFTLHAGGDCTGTVLRPAETFPLTNEASGVSRTTTNQAVTVEETATVSWEVVFTSSNPFVEGSRRCESTSLTITN